MLLRSPFLRHPTVAGLLPVNSQVRISGDASFKSCNWLRVMPYKRHVMLSEKAQIALLTVLPVAMEVT